MRLTVAEQFHSITAQPAASSVRDNQGWSFLVFIRVLVVKR
jgi:hypothetical protein